MNKWLSKHSKTSELGNEAWMSYQQALLFCCSQKQLEKHKSRKKEFHSAGWESSRRKSSRRLKRTKRPWWWRLLLALMIKMKALRLYFKTNWNEKASNKLTFNWLKLEKVMGLKSYEKVSVFFNFHRLKVFMHWQNWVLMNKQKKKFKFYVISVS